VFLWFFRLLALIAFSGSNAHFDFFVNDGLPNTRGRATQLQSDPQAGNARKQIPTDKPSAPAPTGLTLIDLTS
jgi:hypothetical protein